jgi:hypothetical protein
MRVHLGDVITTITALQIFVLKQTWQQYEMSKFTDAGSREATVDEAEMYRRAGSDLMYSAENVRVEGEYDTTSRIRDGLCISTYGEWKEKAAEEEKKNLTGRTNKARERDEDEEPFLYMKLSDTRVDKNIFLASASQVVPRSLTRLILRQSGLAVKYFADLVELIQIFLDCIKGVFSFDFLVAIGP